MLSKEMIKSLAVTAGISADDLANAISSEEEKKIDIKTKKHFTDEEWEKYEDSIDKERKEKYDDGVKTGTNKTIKYLKEKVGLDYEGRKPEDFIKKFKDKVIEDEKLSPEPKIKTLETDIEKLRDEILEKDNKINESNQKYQGLKIRSSLEQFITSDLPVGMTKDDALTIMQSKMSFGYDDEGKEVVTKNGEVLKTKTRENVGFKDAISDFQTEKKWRNGKEGRENDDDTGGGGFSDPKKIRKMSDMSKYFEENNINPLSQEARGYINDANSDASESKEEFEFDE